jgi:hypothetical protein
MAVRACLGGAIAVAAATLAGCHAHGASGLDHGVTVSFSRSPLALSTAQLSVQNGSSDAVCLGPASFQPGAFVVKSSKGVENSSAPSATALAAACLPLAAGGHMSQSVDVGQGHSRYAMQTGSVCYNYDFGPSAPGAAAWHATGQICE